MTKLHLIMTSDTHGHWLNRPDDAAHSLQNTASAVKHLKDTFQAAGEPYLTIDLGDFIQGSSFSTYLSQENEDGSVLARAMNQIGYDYQILGNHEFNFGRDYRQNILGKLNANLLVGNLINKATGQPIVGESYAIQEIAGLKVGIIGVTTHYIPHWELPEHYQGVEFLDAFETAQTYARQLRPQVDVLIVAYHGGFERDLETKQPLEALTGENQGSKMLAEIPEIDVLLTGHQHREIAQQVGTTYTVQAGYAGEKVGHIELTLEDGQVMSRSGDLVDANQFEPDVEVVQAMQPEIGKGHEWLNEVVGTAPIETVTDNEFEARKSGHPYIELLHHIQLKETGAQFSAVALVNDAFRYFTGPITNEILLKSYPYFNLVAKVGLTGAELLKVIEYDFEYYALNDQGELIVSPDYLEPKPRHYNFDLYSGLKVVVDMTKDRGERIQNLIDEETMEPLDPTTLYTVAMSQYRAVGGGDFVWLGQNKIVSLTEKDIATLLIDALKETTTSEWDNINQNYSHIVWQPEVTLSPNPLSQDTN